MFRCTNEEHDNFSDFGTYATCMGYQPRYDKNGVEKSVDPNTYTTKYVCNECGKEYMKVRRGRYIELFEIDADKPFFTKGPNPFDMATT